MWTDEQFKQYRKESTALETSVENILGDESLRSCVRSVCSNLRINSYRFRVVIADATDFKIEDEHNISFQIRRNDNTLTISVCDGCTNIFVEYISLRKWKFPEHFIDLDLFIDRAEHIFRYASDTKKWIAEANKIVRRGEGKG